MLTFFRNFFKSKIGLGLTLAFLVLIAIAFASSDVANTGTFGGIGNAGRVATVDDESITTAELSQATTSAFERVRQQDPTLSMPAFVAQGGLDSTLTQLVDRLAIATFARDIGLRAGDNLINSEIRQIGAFRNASGQFDESVYRQALRTQGLSDEQVRMDLGQGLLARQLILPVQYGATIPAKVARRYAALFKERREGTIAFIPTTSFLPEAEPDEAQLRSYYQQNREDYIRPERRVIRFATFEADAVEDRIEPSDEAIARYYAENREEYAARETRSFRQVILPSEEAARELAATLRAGTDIEQAAGARGLRSGTVGPATRSELASDSSAGVAAAYFEGSEGSVTQPARSGLGWHVARIADVERVPGRPLEAVRGEIAETLRERNRLAALSDISAEIEQRLDEGTSLSQIARDLGLNVEETPPLTADGAVYEGEAGNVAAEALRPAIPTAFQMEEGEPQIAEVERGTRYVVFEAARIMESRVAPLAEIRERVAADWRIAQGSQQAGQVADRVLARLESGADVQQALAAAGASAARVEPVDLTRQQLAERGARAVPPPLALLFSMAEGTAKKLEAGGRRGYYVVSLADVEPGTITDDDPLYAQALASLGPVFGEEYVAQFIAAIRERQGVERNEDAIAAVRRQLAGEN
jgi:peptidyl-prolyl cis-trans isomerase D